MCEAVFCGILRKIMRFEVETFLLFIAFHAFYLPRCAKIICNFIDNFRNGSAATERKRISSHKLHVVIHLYKHMCKITLMRLVHV